MKSRILWPLVAVAAATLACSVFVGGPDYPQTPDVASTQALAAAETQIAQSLVDSAQTGTFRLVLSESQLTAYLASQLPQDSSTITDPEIVLRDGVVQVYGKAQSGMFTATLAATARVTLDDQGQPLIQITSAELGPVPMPDALTSSLSSMLQEALTGSMGPAATGFRLEDVQIADGTMTITGRTK